MDLKSVKLTGLKAAGDPGADDLEPGQFKAYASTWTRTPDSYGDIVLKGAFADTLAEWDASGAPVPVLFGHDLVDPFSNIGATVSLAEDDHGLLAKIQLDLENPKGAQVYRMLKGRRIGQMSFAYDTLEDGIVDLGKGETARELRKLKLYEISVVPFGANSDTEVLAVKALAEGLKAGRVLSTKNLDSLVAAREMLDAVIKAAAGESNESDDETNTTDVTTDEAQAGKSAASRRLSALAQVAYIRSL